MSKSIFAVIFIPLCFISCTKTHDALEKEEESLLLPTTVQLDVFSNTKKSFPISSLIEKVGYVELDNTKEALMSTVTDIKVIDSLIYIRDINDRLKCFNLNGKYLRNAFILGGGPQEINHFYDFDVNKNALNILDGGKSAIKVFDHQGTYKRTIQLPFRAVRFRRMPNGYYLFNLDPYSIKNDDQPYQIALTDSAFKPIKKLFKYNKKITTRTPYFENCATPTYFSPLFGRSIFMIKDTTFLMKYLLKFNGKYFPEDEKLEKFKYAAENDIYYCYRNAFHNKNYLIQTFYTDKENSGTLFVRFQDDKPAFIKNMEMDMDNILDFSFENIKWYDEKTDYFWGASPWINTEDIDKESLSKLRNVIDKKYQRYILRDEYDNSNQIIMYCKLKDEIKNLW